MVHNHNHLHHVHSLQLCEHCDVVYCSGCGKEWGKQYSLTGMFRSPFTFGTGFTASHTHS